MRAILSAVLASVVVTLCAVALSACVDPKAEVNRLAGQVKPQLTSDLVEVRKENLVAKGRQLVLVIGENHASVKSQRQLAELLERLLQKQALDEIFIEGSDGGPYTGTGLAARAAADSGQLPDGAYWQDMLARGRVSGYEYVAINHPDLQIYGVEDMGAKTRNAIFLQARGLRDDTEMFAKAASALDESLASLRSAHPDADVGDAPQKANAAHEAAQGYAAAVEASLKDFEDAGSAQEQLARLESELRPVLQRLKDATPSVADHEKWVEEHNQLVRRAQAIIRNEGERSPELLTLGAQIEDLRTRIRGFERLHAEELSTLQRLGPLHAEASKKLEQAAPAFESSQAQLESAHDKARDAYFIAANGVQALAEANGLTFPALQTFFVDHARAMEKASVARSDDLAERDTAMVRQTMSYMGSHAEKKRFVLVVGFAHLAGIEEKLAASGVSFVSAKLAASDDAIEDWEGDAWHQRNGGKRLLFVSSDGRRLKEITLLQDPNWKSEQLKRFDFFQTSLKAGDVGRPIGGFAWDSRIYEDVKVGSATKTIRVGRFPFDPNAQTGAYILDRGPVPGRPGEFYEIIDRDIAGAKAKELSDAGTAFVYHYGTRPADQRVTSYRFKTSAGEKSLDEFVASAPSTSGGKPKRVVLFGEADEFMDGAVASSRLWSLLRGGGRGAPPKKPPPGANDGATGDPEPGNGGGDGNGRGNGGNGGAWWTAFAFADDGRERPRLLRTINPERAKRHLAALDKQDPDRLGDIAYFDEEQVRAWPKPLQFTPTRGDNSQMVVLVGRNVPELRAKVKAAGEARLLEGKQVVLIMCGDSFGETDALRETLLRHGALMVWSNDRQITLEAGQRLVGFVKEVEESVPSDERPSIDVLMSLAFERWAAKSPTDPALRSFQRSATYVMRELGKWSRMDAVKVAMENATR